MFLKIAIGVVLALVLLFLVARRISTTFRTEHTFHAPVEQVWHAWNDEESIKKWWGPKNYTAPIIRNDLRVGGTYLLSMKSSNGQMFWNTGTYKEVVENQRIVSSLSFADEHGKSIPGSQAPAPGHWQDEITVTVEFVASNGKTKVTVTEVGIPLIVWPLSRIAWAQQFDKMEAQFRH